MSIQLIGLAEVLRTFTEMKKAATSAKMHAGVIQAAERIAGTIRSEAPRGPTGNLKRSIEFGGFKPRQGKPVAAFVRVNAKIAPHAHLVEFGARGGAMPANPFFTRGFNSARESAMRIVQEKAGQAIDVALR